MYVVPYVHLSEVSSHCLSVHYTPSIATQPATNGRNVWLLIIVRKNDPIAIKLCLESKLRESSKGFDLGTP